MQCKACGKDAPREDHEEACNVLVAMRAQAYPDVLDRNGIDWRLNRIRKLETENAALRGETPHLYGSLLGR